MLHQETLITKGFTIDAESNTQRVIVYLFQNMKCPMTSNVFGKSR